MGQQEVFTVIENSKTPLTVREIHIILGGQKSKISAIVAKLEKHKEVESFDLPKDLAKKFFNLSRRVKLYYVP